MQEEATRYLYSLLTRIAKISRKQQGGSGAEEEYGGDLAFLGLLFQQSDGGIESARLRMTDVSRFLMISKPAATQMVARLVDRGLAERTSDESDRRVVYVRATDRGRAVFQQKLNERLAYIERAADRIGLEKSARLGELLDEFVDALVSVTEEN